MSTTAWTRASRAFVLAGGVFLLAACSDTAGPEGTAAQGSGQATLLLVQDAAPASSLSERAPRLSLAGDVPLDAIAAIELTLSRIEVHRVGTDDDVEDEGEEGAGDGESEGDGDGEGGDDGDGEGGDDGEDEGDPASPWVSLELEATEPIDLLSLPETGGVQIAGGTLPAGTYNQVRLFFSEATLVLDAPLDVMGGQQTLDPGDYELFIPSGAQTGVKLHTTFEIADGDSETVTIAVATTASVQTVVWAGFRFLMTPVLMEK